MATRRSDHERNIKCDRCHKRKLKNTDIFKHCVDCEAKYCKECADTHITNRMLSHHKLIGLQMCYRHTDMEIELYCENHHMVGCILCMEENHRHCTTVCPIDNYNTQIIKQDQARKLTNDIDNTLKDIQRNTTEFEEYIARLAKTKTELIAMYADLILEHDKINERQQEVEKYLKSANEYSNELEAIRDTIEHITNTVSVPSILNTHWVDIIAEIKTFNLTKEQLDNGEQTYIKNKSSKLINSIRSLEIAPGGICGSDDAVNMERSSDDAVNTERRSDDAVNTERSSDDAVNMERSSDDVVNMERRSDDDESIGRSSDMAENLISYNIKISNDSNNCDIQSMCIAKNDDIFIADYENMSLKCLRKQDGGLVTGIKFEGKPCHICMLGDNEVLVCLEEQSFFGKQYKLASVRVDPNQLRLNHNSKRLSHNCGGLAANNNKVYVSDAKKTVHVYQLPGFSSYSTEPYFMNCRIMGFSKDMNTLLVINGEKGLYLWNVNTESKTSEKFEFPIDKIQTFSVVDHGKVFLVDDQVREIQISATRKVLSMKTHDLGNVVNIQALCYNSRDKTLIIATRKSNTLIVRKIEVLEH